jgi:hypothetical protein
VARNRCSELGSRSVALGGTKVVRTTMLLVAAVVLAAAELLAAAKVLTTAVVLAAAELLATAMVLAGSESLAVAEMLAAAKVLAAAEVLLAAAKVLTGTEMLAAAEVLTGTEVLAAAEALAASELRAAMVLLTAMVLLAATVLVGSGRDRGRMSGAMRVRDGNVRDAVSEEWRQDTLWGNIACNRSCRMGLALIANWSAVALDLTRPGGSLGDGEGNWVLNGPVAIRLVLVRSATSNLCLHESTRSLNKLAVSLLAWLVTVGMTSLSGHRR